MKYQAYIIAGALLFLSTAFNSQINGFANSLWANIYPLFHGLLSYLHHEHHYKVQVFSQDPLVLYISNFISPAEISHILLQSENKFQRTPVFRGKEQFFDDEVRVSETAHLDRDHVLDRIRDRVMKMQGWRGDKLQIEDFKVQRYGFNGFFGYHYDWDCQISKGNRATTFMIYVKARCTGGGTNFPQLPAPTDRRWCDKVLDCDAKYPGATFKPVEGAAVFWENMHPNGSLNSALLHAGLPVASGEKIGLNIWTWDKGWRPPVDGPMVAPPVPYC